MRLTFYAFSGLIFSGVIIMQLSLNADDHAYADKGSEPISVEMSELEVSEALESRLSLEAPPPSQ